MKCKRAAKLNVVGHMLFGEDFVGSVKRSVA
jgi:hypothetical protein